MIGKDMTVFSCMVNEFVVIFSQVRYINFEIKLCMVGVTKRTAKQITTVMHKNTVLHITHICYFVLLLSCSCCMHTCSKTGMLPLSTRVYKWIPATCLELASHLRQGGEGDSHILMHSLHARNTKVLISNPYSSPSIKIN